ncbi:MAG: hypothetical protein KDA41_18770, partial [Planctomycetales bacterium]|nr:hypothetical protein [Planctomycetales bacterium]
ADALVPPGDAEALAAKIASLAADPAQLNRLADANWRRASEYALAAIAARRTAFYETVRQAIMDWSQGAARKTA